MNINKIDYAINGGRPNENQQTNINLSLGNKIGEGFGGVVYQDNDNPHKVIKEIKLDNPTDIDEAIKEYTLFRAYYGDDSATITHNENYCHIHMNKLPGNTIDKTETFPDSAEAFFLSMISEMESKGIYHADLKPDNVLYSMLENRFFPIDFSNTAELRLTASPEELKAIDEEYKYRINAILGIIGHNISEITFIDQEPVLGEFVGSGRLGSVYLAKDDTNYMFKRFVDTGKETKEQAKIEASNFNRFYGACSAEVLIHHDNVYIKMLRVPGISLNELTALPREAHAAFYEFLSGMAKARIMHDGLCEQNIHYDPTANKFYPIDMGNSYYEYFNADDDTKTIYNFMQQARNEEILASINVKIKD